MSCLEQYDLWTGDVCLASLVQLQSPYRVVYRSVARLMLVICTQLE